MEQSSFKLCFDALETCDNSEAEIRSRLLEAPAAMSLRIAGLCERCMREARREMDTCYGCEGGVVQCDVADARNGLIKFDCG